MEIRPSLLAVTASGSSSSPRQAASIFFFLEKKIALFPSFNYICIFFLGLGCGCRPIEFFVCLKDAQPPIFLLLAEMCGRVEFPWRPLHSEMASSDSGDFLRRQSEI